MQQMTIHKIEIEAERLFKVPKALTSSRSAILTSKRQKETFIKGANFALEMDRWVKVEDGMPDNGDYVLILFCKEVFVARYSGEQFRDDDDRVFKLTHWQTLPKLPQ